ncbi:MAG: helix-turn-helix domain-containing protein [Candidatus Hydrothermarchaeota archaeon]|nr:helix-turn-helix domain-containing protein [Candidatus Hydrothermarchaeota archaeon]
MKNFNNYISRRDAVECLKRKVTKVTITPTALKQTPPATLRRLENNGVELVRVTTRGRPRKLGKGQVKRILAMRQEDVSFYKIARLTGVAKSTVYDYWMRFKDVNLGEEELRRVKIREARRLFVGIIKTGLGGEITELARRAHASSSVEEMAYILGEIEDIIDD